ncbi:Uncharacterised protein [Clostridium sporogenes]|nr:Uncharacterised protein [Clostridium sporogenes]
MRAARRAIAAPAIRTGERADVVEAHADFAQRRVRGAGGQLPDVERIAHHEVMDRVRAAEIEAEQLERQHPPRVQHLRLLDHVARVDVAEIVHVRADEVDAEAAHEVRPEPHHRQEIDDAHRAFDDGRHRHRVTERMQREQADVIDDERVPQRVVQVTDRHVRRHLLDAQLQALGRILHRLRGHVLLHLAAHRGRPQHDGEHAVRDHQQALHAPALAVGDAEFLEIRFAARHLVVMQVHAPARPRVDRAGPREPAQRHHQVIGPRRLLEVHQVDQVVLELVDQRRDERGERQRDVPRDRAARIQPRDREHRAHRHGHHGRADEVLVVEQRKACADRVARGVHFAADVRDLVGVVAKGGSCGLAHRPESVRKEWGAMPM